LLFVNDLSFPSSFILAPLLFFNFASTLLPHCVVNVFFIGRPIMW
jgi:hypothetical protein